MEQIPHPLKTQALQRFLFPVLLGLLVLACDDLDGHQHIEASYHQNVLRFDVNAPFESLDPIEISRGGPNQMLPFLYSYLFIPNVKGELEPDLALDWSYNAESLTWTIKLRPDARLHKGKIVTAQDVVFSLKKWITKNSYDLWATVDRFEPVSPQMLTIVLKKNDPYLFYRIWDLEIIPEAEKAGTDHGGLPVGSGPYIYETRKGNQSVTLKANPDYYGGPPSR